LVLFLLLQNPDLPSNRHQNQQEQAHELEQEQEQEPVAAAGDVDEGKERIPGEGPRTGPAVRVVVVFVVVVVSDYYLRGLCIVLVNFYFNKNNLLYRIVH
jgi:hypothetical protein